MKRVVEANRVRGDLGCGWVNFAWNQSYYQVTRATDTDQLHRNNWNGNVLLGHVRAPTGGQTNTVRELHPIETRDFLLAHNGLLLDWNEQWKSMAQPLGLPCIDTSVIAAEIQMTYGLGYGVVQCISKVSENLRGQFACWMYEKATQEVFLWRVMSPIAVTFDGQSTLFGSVLPTGLQQTSLDEGVIWRYDREISIFRNAGAFSYKEPYVYDKG